MGIEGKRVFRAVLSDRTNGLHDAVTKVSHVAIMLEPLLDILPYYECQMLLFYQFTVDACEMHVYM